MFAYAVVYAWVYRESIELVRGRHRVDLPVARSV